MVSKFIFKARDPHEQHRVATPLELFFDLVYVIAMAASINGLHHGIVGGHIGEVIPVFALAFFGTWWSWSNYTFYASAFDNGGLRFQLQTMLSMLGAIFMAIGITSAFETGSWAVTLGGFVIMRVSISLMWFKVAREIPEYRKLAMYMGIGIILVQVWWVVVVLGLSKEIVSKLVWLGMILELSVPRIAEGLAKKVTPWHPHHLAERYGLLAIIILGEGFVGIVNTLAPLLAEGYNPYWEVAPLGFAMSMILFSAFMLYFKVPFANILHHVREVKNARFTVFYGHLFIYLGIALISVGLELTADAFKTYVAEHGHNAMAAASGTHGVSGDHHGVSEFFAAAFLSGATAFYLIVISTVHALSTKTKTVHLRGMFIGLSLNAVALVLVYTHIMPLYYAMWLICLSPLLNALLYKTDVIGKIADQHQEHHA